MKKLAKGLMLLLSVFIASSCKSNYNPVLSSKQGVNFDVISLNQAKEKAKIEHKQLFVFVHATWCPTCKKMENEVFVQEQLGKVYNLQFVNEAIDLDSKEGKLLNQSMPISATPTLFYFDANGVLIKKVEGFCNVNQLLSYATK